MPALTSRKVPSISISNSLGIFPKETRVAFRSRVGTTLGFIEPDPDLPEHKACILHFTQSKSAISTLRWIDDSRQVD
jgi:hypothetical protein